MTTGTLCRRVDFVIFEDTLNLGSLCVFELTVSVIVFPLRLKMIRNEEEEEDRAESPVFSCVSVKSDMSKGIDLDFRNKPGPSHAE